MILWLWFLWCQKVVILKFKIEPFGNFCIREIVRLWDAERSELRFFCPIKMKSIGSYLHIVAQFTDGLGNSGKAAFGGEPVSEFEFSHFF